MVRSIEEVNQMTQSDFVETFGAVFENSPDVARQAWYQHPFADRAELHRAMVDVVRCMDTERQLELICAHPDLAGKAEMAEASVRE